MQKPLAIKILTIFVVALFMLIPISMVEFKVYERQGYLQQAKSKVAQSWTGAQLLMTPIVVIPYQLSAPPPQSGFYADTGPLPLDRLEVLLPDTAHSDVGVSNKSVYKGIYEVPVYNTDMTLSGLFSSEKIQQRIAAIKSLPRFERLGDAYLSMYISDVRGIDKMPTLTVNETLVPLNPGSQLVSLASGLHGNVSNLLASEPAATAPDLNFSLTVSLRGMGSLSFVPLADDASTRMRSDWPHPEFIGASLPALRDISSAGFNAHWLSTRYSSNSADLLNRCIDTQECHELLSTSSGVNFIKPVDIYLQSERSVKYAILFIGLSFVTFFIFEYSKRIRIHPIQYAFVGLAISVFYLLLISLAEHIAFYWAYSIAVICCSALLLFYVRYMLKSFRLALLFSAMILGLYGLLYVIIQAEDFALLMGTLLVFLVLAALMFVTRKIDWYKLAEISDEPAGAN